MSFTLGIWYTRLHKVAFTGLKLLLYAQMENPYKGASPNSIVLSKNTFHWSQISTLSHSFTSPQNNIKCFTMLLSWQLICDNCGTYRSSQIECCTQFFSAKLVPVQLINELEGHELDLTLACHKSLGVCSRACSDKMLMK